MAGLTRHTPQTVRDWLAQEPLAFPEEWTLTQVAEETHRRYLAGVRYGSPGVAVTRWAMFKLSRQPGFRAEHWEWLTEADGYGRKDGISRVMCIIRPAVGDNIAWKKPGPELESALQAIRDAIRTILQGVRANHSLSVSLPDVASMFVELKPLADAAMEMWYADTAAIRDEVQRARQAGREPRFGPRPLRGARQPYLTDFLEALEAKLDGKLGSYIPKLKSDEDGRSELDAEDQEEEEELGALDPAAAAELARKFGISPTALGLPAPIPALRPGGDFGAYPNRKDALERAIVMAFPRAFLGDPWMASDAAEVQRSVPMAAVIEEACIAWFGKSRPQKDINALIRDERATLEASAAEVKATREHVREVEKRALAKLKDPPGQSETLRKFLDLD